MLRIFSSILLVSILLLVGCNRESKRSGEDTTGYQKIKKDLIKGWGTYNTRDVLSQVLMPRGLEISYDLKFQGKNFEGYLNRAQFTGGNEWADPKLQPIAHAPDGSYTRLRADWKDVHVFIETAIKDNDLVILFTPADTMEYPSHAVIRPGLLWNKRGTIEWQDGFIRAKTNNSSTAIFPVTETVQDFNVSADNAYFALSLNKPAAVSTGKKRSLKEVQYIIDQRKKEYNNQARSFGNQAGDAWKAITTCMSWNTIYEPIHKRVVSTVSRVWNVKRGGYSFFGWDNFFLSYLASIYSKELAYSNVIEHLNDMTKQGFIPNCSQGNGRKTWDRSQPPVGSIMVKEIYKKYPEKWFLELVFDSLLTWNQWWLENRLYQGMLCWGSNDSKNPYNDNRHHDAGAAMLESGIDDSPMYEGIPFNREANVMELHDVGLNSLYIADCKALADMAKILGKKQTEKKLRGRAEKFTKRLQTLWHEKDGFFYNKRTDNGEFHKIKSPTLFYPLIAEAATQEQAEKMMKKHFFNPGEFAGEWILPSISRDNPAFEEQKYWKGAIWAPMNFLIYLGLRNYDLPEAQKELAKKSTRLFVKEWNRRHFVSENYSAITGTGDGPRIKSDRFYTWGALLGAITLIEDGYMPDPAEKMSNQ